MKGWAIIYVKYRAKQKATAIYVKPSSLACPSLIQMQGSIQVTIAAVQGIYHR